MKLPNVGQSNAPGSARGPEEKAYAANLMAAIRCDGYALFDPDLGRLVDQHVLYAAAKTAEPAALWRSLESALRGAGPLPAPLVFDTTVQVETAPGAATAAALNKAGVAAAILLPLHPAQGPQTVLLAFAFTARSWSTEAIAVSAAVGHNRLHAVSSSAGEAAPRLEDSHFGRVLEALGWGYCLCDMVCDAAGTPSDYRFLDTNLLFETMTGLNDPVGRTALELVPNLEKSWIETYARVGFGREVVRFHDASPALGRSFDVVAVPLDPVGRFSIVFRDVSDASLSAVGLRSSQALSTSQAIQSQAVYDAAPVGLVLFDRDYRFLRVNRRLAEINGIPIEDHVGRHFEEILPGPTVAYLQEIHPRLLAGEEVPPHEVQIIDPIDGQDRSFLVSYKPLRDEFGRISWFVGSVQENTQLKATERALWEKNNELQTVLDAAPAAVWISYDPECAVIRGNRAAAELLELPAHANASKSAREHSPTNFEVMQHGRLLEPHELPMQIAAATGQEVVGFEETLVFQDGREVTLFGNARPLFDDDGKVRGSVGAFIDISELASARSELSASRDKLQVLVEERTAELQAKEGRLRSIFESSFSLQGLLDVEGRIIDVNGTALRMIEAPLADLVGTEFSQSPWFTGTKGMEQQVREGIQAAAAGEIVRQEVHLLMPIGGWRWFDFQMRPFPDAEGKTVGIVAEAVETTARRAAEDHLRQAQKMDAIGQLTGGVAHDFNNLLTVIRSASEMLKLPNLPTDRRDRYLAAITETVERAAKLTSQLLAFSRQHPHKAEVFDVCDRVRAVGEMLDTILGSRITLILDLADCPMLVEADISQFETALVNLAANARDAMDGEGVLKIAVRRAERLPPFGQPGHTPYVSIALTDTGCGIPAENLDQVFEPFYSTKPVGQGTGLGLSQVYGFTQQSAGQVTVQSAPKEGATFTIFLPLSFKPPPPVIPPPPPPEPFTEVGGRILVVEDSTHVGAIVCQLLEELGYETVLAANADEALTLLADRENRFDLVFSDMVMPGISGAALGRRIRDLDPTMPFLLTSGYSQAFTAEWPIEFEVLAKPYSAETLSKAVIDARRRQPARTHP